MDTETGEVSLLKYAACDDVGNVINPMIVEGRSTAVSCRASVRRSGRTPSTTTTAQLLSGSLMDYAVPKIHNLINFDLDRTVTPCPHNPLGVKGVGEAGAIAAPPAVVNAVIDALEPYGVKNLDMPLSSESVWKAIQGE